MIQSYFDKIQDIITFIIIIEFSKDNGVSLFIQPLVPIFSIWSKIMRYILSEHIVRNTVFRSINKLEEILFEID